ncbi:PepSY-like domain-containing protein [Brumimicrobium aurantiacum]|nr:PepSY-like domain-containing protein [Brumimicrobium aurantiacum]
MMKTKAIQLVAALLIGTGTLFAQDIPQNQVPSVVVNNFKKEFPKAVDIEWEMKGEQYNVEFEIGWSKDFEAWFSADGTIIRYTEEISQSELPSDVKSAITKNYPGYSIDDVEKLVSGKEVSYEVELEKGSEDVDVIFSENGSVISFK